MDIQINNLFKSFGETRVLEGFSATFEEGKQNTLTGNSGCGKTTLLRLILGLETAEAGEITGVPEGPVGTVFQEDRLISDVSVMKNILLTAAPGTDRKTVCEHLEEVGLQGFEEVIVRDLSGGMKRRVAVVRAICADTPLVILDEPFSGLDEETKEKTLAYITKRTAGKTVILVSHEKVAWDREIHMDSK